MSFPNSSLNFNESDRETPRPPSPSYFATVQQLPLNIGQAISGSVPSVRFGGQRDIDLPPSYDAFLISRPSSHFQSYLDQISKNILTNLQSDQKKLLFDEFSQRSKSEGEKEMFYQMLRLVFSGMTDERVSQFECSLSNFLDILEGLSKISAELRDPFVTRLLEFEGGVRLSMFLRIQSILEEKSFAERNSLLKQVLLFIPSEVPDLDFPLLLEVVGETPVKERKSLIDQGMNLLRISGLSIKALPNVLSSLLKVPSKERKPFVDQAIQLIERDINEEELLQILGFFREKIAGCERRFLVKQAIRLSEERKTNSLDRIAFIILISKISGVEHRRSFVDQVLLLSTASMSGTEMRPLIHSLMKVPLKEREELTRQALQLISEHLGGEERSMIIQELHKLSSLERSSIIVPAGSLISLNMTGTDICSLLSFVRQISPEDRGSLLADPYTVLSRGSFEEDSFIRSLLMIPFLREIEGRELGEAILEIQKIPIETRDITMAQLIRMASEKTRKIRALISSLGKISLENLTPVVEATLPYVSEDGEETGFLLSVCAAFPLSKNVQSLSIEDIHVLTPRQPFFFSGMAQKEQQFILSRLIALPPREREVLVKLAVVILYDKISGKEPQMKEWETTDILFSLYRLLPGRRAFEVSEVLPDFSEDDRPGDRIKTIRAQFNQSSRYFLEYRLVLAKQDPVKYPIHVLAHLESLLKDSKHLLPLNIEYTEDPGLDGGGLTRSFITELMRSFCNQTKFVKTDAQGAIPQLYSGDSKPYATLGKIFRACLEKLHSVTTGQVFHPLVFEMIFSLSASDLEKDPFAKDEAASKLVQIYAKNYLLKENLEFKKLEETKGTRAAVIKTFQEYSGSVQAAIQDYKIDQVVHAIRLIARAMYKTLNNPGSWNLLKGGSAHELNRRIQGVLSRSELIKRLELTGSEEGRSQWMEYMQRWIKESDPYVICRFVEAISGSSTLPFNQKIKIYLYSPTQGDPLPTFHTCMYMGNFPSNYNSYEIFKEKLERSIEEALVGSFLLDED